MDTMNTLSGTLTLDLLALECVSTGKPSILFQTCTESEIWGSAEAPLKEAITIKFFHRHTRRTSPVPGYKYGALNMGVFRGKINVTDYVWAISIDGGRCRSRPKSKALHLSRIQTSPSMWSLYPFIANRWTNVLRASQYFGSCVLLST